MRDIDLDSLASLPRVKQCGLFSVSMLILLAFGYVTVWRPTLSNLSFLLAKEQQLQTILEQKQQRVLLLASHQTELDQLAEVRVQIQEQMVQSASITEVLSLLNRMAQQHSLLMERIVQSTSQSTGSFLQSSLQFELLGQYQQIASFFHAVAILPESLYFDELHWRRAEVDSTTLILTGEVYLLQSLDEGDSAN
ncbi:MAG: type 4a pilus biogenesis protein PilO [Vibrio sp.]|uniref:type 4a pilus biogenesis protein PilO n=1 Tax=Vibrio TaxID=662 RepID=UPI001ED74430|nr:type 4a pilus biogenesis protein PilO [Vibrio sp.]NRB68276.1 type 4a pilus biogenesis protein PilO [Vibrio sp.]